jgi:ribosomal protein S6--L-glutamate ligase
MKNPKPYILLLTSRPDSWAATRLREAARLVNVSLRAFDSNKSFLEIKSDGGIVRFNGREVSLPLSIIPRLGPANQINSLTVLAQFESIGVPVCNGSYSADLAHDTYRTLLALKKAGVQIPHTARLISIKDLKNARKIIPGPPWILKTYTGAMGIGTMLIHKTDQLEALAATLWALGQPVLLQEYLSPVAGATNSDIRSLVVGKSVIGAIRRSAGLGEFRTNVHQGGRPDPVKLSKQEIKLAIKVTNAVGLNIAGVDWIETENGPVVLEVNATPGFQGFECATGIDAARAMVEYAMSLKFGD